MSLWIFSQLKVWIDYDLSYGQLFNEIDDGYALIHALLAEERLKSFVVAGITSVHGNTDNMLFQKQATEKILHLMGRSDLKFYTGAGSAKELGHSNEAVEALKLELEKGPLTILAMGRLTNIASTLILYPNLQGNIKEIIIMGGRRLEETIHFGNYNIEFPDLNIDGDFEALHFLEKHQVKITLIPTAAMRHRLINKDHLKKMADSVPLAKSMAKHARVWRWIWKYLLGSPEGFIPWDVFLVSYLTHPHAFKFEVLPYSMQRMKNTTHHLYSRKYRWKEKYFLTVSKSLKTKTQAKYCTSISENHVNELIDFWCQ